MAKMPVEEMVALPLENLLELAQEAKQNFVEAKGLKDWIDGVITLRLLANDKSNKNDNNNNFGGQNEQTTDY